VLACASDVKLRCQLTPDHRTHVVPDPPSLPLARMLLCFHLPPLVSMQRRGSPTGTGTSRAGSIRCGGGHAMIELSSQRGRRRWRVTDGYEMEKLWKTARCQLHAAQSAMLIVRRSS
jgi:hypothetical protein